MSQAEAPEEVQETKRPKFGRSFSDSSDHNEAEEPQAKRQRLLTNTLLNLRNNILQAAEGGNMAQ